MTFQDAVRTCLSKYVTLRGRAARPEFWWFALFVVAGGMLLELVDRVLLPGDARFLSPLFSLATLLPMISVSVRRLHDIGRTGWWVFLHLIPLIGFLVMLYFYLLKGDGGHNRFGSPPPR